VTSVLIYKYLFTSYHFECKTLNTLLYAQNYTYGVLPEWLDRGNLLLDGPTNL